MGNNNLQLGRILKEGVSWVAIAQTFQRVSQFAVLAILARFLSPDDFGIVAMATVFTGFLQVFNDFGVGKAVIQTEVIDEIIISSCFWMNILVSLCLFLFTIFISKFVAGFYKEPVVSDVLNLLGFSFPLLGLSIVHEHLLQRKSQFKMISLAEIGASIGSIIVAIVLALMGYGYWALVWRVLSLTFLKSSILIISTPNIIKFKFDLKKVQSLLVFSFNLLVFNIINYFSRNIDYLLIGRVLGATELGYYSLAYRLMMVPLESISSVVGKVLYPSLSRLQNNVTRFQQLVLKACRSIAFLSFPIYLVLAATSNIFIEVFFGEKWISAVVILQILCFVGLRQSIISFLGNIFLSLGKTKIMMQLGMFGSAVNVIAIVIGLNWGIKGVASAYLLSTWLVLSYPMIKIPFSLIGLRIKDLIVELWRVFFVSASTASIIVFIQILWLNRINLNIYVSFSVLILLSVFLFFLFSIFLNKNHFFEFVKFVFPEKINFFKY